jgi:hypothetical protein
VPPLQAQSPEFKLQSHLEKKKGGKRKKKRKENEKEEGKYITIFTFHYKNKRQGWEYGSSCRALGP